MVTIREWSWRDGSEYRDRNGDGIVDWQAKGDARYSDGYGVYKEDNDYDGFYEREFQAGGIAHHFIYDKRIHESVPQLHKIYPPTKVTKKPRQAEQGAEVERGRRLR